MDTLTLTEIDDGLAARARARSPEAHQRRWNAIKEAALGTLSVGLATGVVIVSWNVGIEAFRTEVKANIQKQAVNISGMKTGAERVQQAEYAAATGVTGAAQKAYLLEESRRMALTFAAERMSRATSNPMLPALVEGSRYDYLPVDLKQQVESLPLSKQRRFTGLAELQSGLVAAEAADLAVGMAENMTGIVDTGSLTPAQSDRFSAAIANRAVSQAIRAMAETHLLELAGQPDPSSVAEALAESYRDTRPNHRL